MLVEGDTGLLNARIFLRYGMFKLNRISEDCLCVTTNSLRFYCVTKFISRRMHNMCQCVFRQKGYAYSAIEYAYECYCDNTFKSSLLRHEK